MVGLTADQTQARRRTGTTLPGALQRVVQTAEDFRSLELGEVLLPVLTPLAATHPDPEVRLGRVTVWEEVDGVEVPAGQRLLLIDDEEIPILEVEELEIQPAPAATP